MQTLIPITRTYLLLSVLSLFFAPHARAQNQVVYSLQPASKLWVEGTSNKSDWTVRATEWEATVAAEEAAAGPDLRHVQVTVPSAKVLSEKSTIMDRLMHDALQVEAHPEIVYELTRAEPVPASAGAQAFALQTTGRLTLAGVTKEIDLVVQGEKLQDGQVRFTGSYPMQMSDFGMTPPSAMFGALRTGDHVVVHFDLVVAPER